MEGCAYARTKNVDLTVIVKNFITPDAVRDTDPFVFELYRSYDSFHLGD